ncbi:uncharacterized protein LOC127813706 [Diospyros lotus]|uniref:uncharacterized protein LOC127813706 n=1 Tax=Diospyros lotus TaxID=55363 RepID=UPI0022549C64|nr:uncharacterized protein LOC127813706 [Diospyros lotus]
MQSPCHRDASKACFHGCFPAPFSGEQLQHPNPSRSGGASPRQDFVAATASSLHPVDTTRFTNHESLPSLPQAFSYFTTSFPHYSHTSKADQIRAQHYFHLSLSNHVCLDYLGHCLFSYSQHLIPPNPSSIASSSSSPPAPLPPSLDPNYSSISNKVPFFDIVYKSVSLSSQVLHGGGEKSQFEARIRRRIMGFMNISEEDYSLVFTTNKSSAFRVLADSYPFHLNGNLVTVYDHDSEAVEAMVKSAKKRGARVGSAEFSWPSLRIQTRKLRKMVASKGKKRKRPGLFVFPLQSGTSGARYPYLWISLAQENGWHILLDASALGAKDMDTLGLSLFQPDFIICSFFKVFGHNPSGFGCLFVKKSTAKSVFSSTAAASTGIVSLIAIRQQSSDDRHHQEISQATLEEKGKEIVEGIVDKPSSGSSSGGSTSSSDHHHHQLEFNGLDDADSLGLILISSRSRYLVNWLVNALTSLQHPHSSSEENRGLPLVRIYGPKIRIGRGPAVAFNVYDWKGEKVEATLVQRLADRNNISISCGFLKNIWFSDKYEQERERHLEMKKRSRTREGRGGEEEEEGITIASSSGGGVGGGGGDGINVLTVCIGFLSNFEDMYRVWAFVARFLDADFVEKERWRYLTLNQTTVEL